MADVKWIKIVTDIFDDEKILLIESMPESDAIIVIWFKLLCLTGKINNGGVLMLNDRIAYTDEMLATVFRRNINTVRLAMKTFVQFGMIEIINGTITIPNWRKHQTLDQLEEKKAYMKTYMKQYREKQKLIALGQYKDNSKTNSKVNSKTNSKVNVSSTDKDIELDKDKELEIDKNRLNINTSNAITIACSTNVQLIIDKWNSLNLQQIKCIRNNRLKMLRARIKEYSVDDILMAIGNIQKSSFLRGQNKQNWSINFDWLIKPNNFCKVLENNYIDKGGQDNGNNKSGSNNNCNKKGEQQKGIDFSRYEV